MPYPNIKKNGDIFSNLIKIEVLLIASIGKIAFNIKGLTIHQTLNIHVQQSLYSLPNLSLGSLNRFTCQDEQLLVMIDEISILVLDCLML
jgi:hypothetical protein